MDIVHQQQPCGESCVCTCLAMIIGKPAYEVIREYHSNYMASNPKVTITDYLARYDINAEPMLTTDWSEKENGLFLCAAPSLNIEAATHEIIIDWRDPVSGCVIYDPNMGKEGKKYYVCKWPDDLLDNERNLKGYFFDFRISYQGAKP